MRNLNFVKSRIWSRLEPAAVEMYWHGVDDELARRQQ